MYHLGSEALFDLSTTRRARRDDGCFVYQPRRTVTFEYSRVSCKNLAVEHYEEPRDTIFWEEKDQGPRFEVVLPQDSCFQYKFEGWRDYDITVVSALLFWRGARHPRADILGATIGKTSRRPAFPMDGR